MCFNKNRICLLDQSWIIYITMITSFVWLFLPICIWAVYLPLNITEWYWSDKLQNLGVAKRNALSHKASELRCYFPFQVLFSKAQRHFISSCFCGSPFPSGGPPGQRELILLYLYAVLQKHKARKAQRALWNPLRVSQILFHVPRMSGESLRLSHKHSTCLEHVYSQKRPSLCFC